MAVFEPFRPFIAWPRMVAFGSETGRSTAEKSVASDFEDAFSALKGKLAAQHASCKDPGQPRAALSNSWSAGPDSKMTQISVWPDFQVYDLEQALTCQTKPSLGEVVTQKVALLTEHA